MQIIRIDPSNLKEHIDDIVALSNEFLASLGHANARTERENRAVLEEMTVNGATVLLKLVAGDGGAAGISYYNLGSGYACGGSYLWLNCIYVRPSYQRKGYATRLIQHIEEDGRRRGINLFTCSRDLDNEGSRRLFARSGFQQEESVSISKRIE